LTDIVGSVGLWERDAESMAQAVAHHDAIIGRAVAAAGGVLVRSKGEGDSTFSVFAHPAEAVVAAVAVQEAIAAEPWPLELPVRVRAGMHTGDAEPRDGDWYGPAVNRAARLRALADGGQTLVSGVAAGLVADRLPAAVRLLYRGRRVLRGIERPEEVWELVAADDARLDAPASARVGGLPLALTRFVGRGHDVERLAELIHEERLVTLTGPGGCGKTRMAMEVAAQATGQGEVVWLAELAPLRDGGLVAQTVATAVGFEDAPDPSSQLLAEAELLVGVLVLDNCEHLLDACESAHRAAAGHRTRPARARHEPGAVGSGRRARVAGDALGGAARIGTGLDRAGRGGVRPVVDGSRPRGSARSPAERRRRGVRRAHLPALCDRLGTRLLDDQRARSRRLGEESGNIDIALTWAHEHDPALALGIVGSLGQYWFYYVQASGCRWCDLVTEAAADVTPRARAKALLSAGMIAEKDPAGDRSVGRLREALAI
jgi:class 3 adenylate cyclase